MRLTGGDHIRAERKGRCSGKPEKQLDYDRENWRPVLKCSICNGERVAGFKNIRTGEFKEESFIRSDEELEAFKRRYGISEMKKEY